MHTKQLKPKTEATQTRRPAAGSARRMKFLKRRRADSMDNLAPPRRKGKTKATAPAGSARTLKIRKPCKKVRNAYAQPQQGNHGFATNTDFLSNYFIACR